jgi:hypothetical protein
MNANQTDEAGFTGPGFIIKVTLGNIPHRLFAKKNWGNCLDFLLKFMPV